MNQPAVPPAPASGDAVLRVAVVTALLSAALALTLAGLIAAQVCLLTATLVVAVGLAVPRWIPGLAKDSPPRTALAVGVVALLIAATAASRPGGLFSGELSGPLGAAVAELGLPSAVPIGLLAALAAGALVAVSLELGDRRGVQSALVLGTAVFGLASVAAPGTRLLPAIVLGWPAAMFALARLSASQTIAPRPHPARAGRAVVQPERPAVMHRTAGTGGAVAGAVVRWQVLPVFAVITLSLAALTVAMVSGVATAGERNGGRGSGLGLGGPSASRSAGYLGGDMDLTARGAPPADPVLKVTAGSPRLWRAATLDTYTGRGWLTTSPPSGLPRFVLGSGGSAQLLDRTLPSEPADSRTDQVRPVVPMGVIQVLAPGRLLGVTSTVLNVAGRGYVYAGDQVVITGGGGTSSGYDVRSQVLPHVDDPDTIEAAGAAGPSAGAPPVVDEALDPRWTALPPTVPRRVHLLARTLVADAPSRLAAVQAVQADLAARMTYVLDSPVPPPGADAVDDVLFVSHRGFCEQFATAQVVLLRSVGIPARMAVGYAGGEPGDDGFRTLRYKDAHAWAEVWFPGVGWVSSDPTPPAVVTRAWWQPLRDAAGSLLDEPVAWIAAAVLLALVSTGGALLFRRRSRPATVAGPAERPVDPDLAAAFTRLEADLVAEGRARAPNETVAALARRIALQPALFQPLPLPDPALALAMRVLERALYAAQPPSRQECLAAATAIDQRGGPADVADAAGVTGPPAR